MIAHALIFFIAATTLLPLSAANAQGFANFRHGVALFHPMISAKRVSGTTGPFVFPAFSDAYSTMTDAQLATIRNAGFDFVRLPVNPGPFLQFKGAQRDALDAILHDRVQRILAAGLSVIVDFHPSTTDPEYGGKLIVASADSPLFNSYSAMIARTAKLLAPFDRGRVALELINEPPAGWAQPGFAKWQKMAVKLYQSARSGAPQLPLILSGGSGGNFHGLLALDPTPFAHDPDVVFTFHYYYPYDFTMQSEKAEPVESLLLDLPYPANARPMSDSLSALSADLDKKNVSLADKTADIARATAALTAYKASGFDQASIRADFDQVSSWASSHGIAPSRIFVGEFGVIRRHGKYNGARDDERAAWLHDVRVASENHRFVWSLWSFSGSGGMEITDPPSWTNIDSVTLQALGLRPEATPGVSPPPPSPPQQ